MSPQNKPEPFLVNADAIHGLKDSLNNSFSLENKWSDDTCLQNSKNFGCSESLRVTSLKELSFRSHLEGFDSYEEKLDASHFGVCDFDESMKSVDCKRTSIEEEFFEMNIALLKKVEEKKQRNQSLKTTDSLSNGVRGIGAARQNNILKEAELGEFAKRDAAGNLQGRRTQSKTDVENRNIAMKNLAKFKLGKSEVEEMNHVTKNSGKQKVDAAVYDKNKEEEETVVKHRLDSLDILQRNKKEKGSVEIEDEGKEMQENLTERMLELLKAEDIYELGLKLDALTKGRSGGNDTDEKDVYDVDFGEKWELERQEKGSKISEMKSEIVTDYKIVTDYVCEVDPSVCERNAIEYEFEEIGEGTVLNQEAAAVIDRVETASESEMYTTSTESRSARPEVNTASDVEMAEAKINASVTDVKMAEPEIDTTVTDIKMAETNINATVTDVRMAEPEMKNTATDIKIAQPEMNSTATAVTMAETKINTIVTDAKMAQPKMNIPEEPKRDSNISAVLTRKGSSEAASKAKDHLWMPSPLEKFSTKAEEFDDNRNEFCFFVSGGGSKFQSHHGSLIPAEPCLCFSWISVSDFPAEPPLRINVVSVSCGDDRDHYSETRTSYGSGGGSGFGGASRGASFGDSRAGGGAGIGGSGNGGGRDDDGDQERDGRKPADSLDGKHKAKAAKKLKKKCHLEHGNLTNEQISMLFGWLETGSASVPDNFGEMTKCFRVCEKSQYDKDCRICCSLFLLIKHSVACETNSCRRCDAALRLFVLERNERQHGSGNDCMVIANILLNPDLRKSWIEMLKGQFSRCSEPPSDDDDVPDFTAPDVKLLSAPIVTGSVSLESQPNRVREIVQGPPPIVDPECWSMFPDPARRPLESIPPTNYSMPVNPGEARSGSVVYGSKNLMKHWARQLHDTAEGQRTGDRPLVHPRFVSRVGVILQSQAANLKIRNYNYEADEEFILVTDKALGSGVSGSCFVGWDCETAFKFCAKKIPLHKFFESELSIWLDMEHPDIVQLYGFVAYDSFIYILQELIIGPTLKEFIASNSCLDSFIALTFLQHLLTLLEYLKEKRVIHNDIKADNLLVREPGTSTRLVLIDFGLAMQTSHVPPDVSPVGGQTQWSPEKAASEGYSFPADLWAAIAVFVHMLSGVEPWSVRFKRAKYLHFIIKGQSPPLQDVPENIPSPIYQLIVSGWTVDPALRPSAFNLLRHDAFRLLDSCDRSSELFSCHLTTMLSPAIEMPNIEEILDEQQTEELISLANQHISLNQWFPLPESQTTSSIHETPSLGAEASNRSGFDAVLYDRNSSINSLSRYNVKPLSSIGRYTSGTGLPPVDEEQPASFTLNLMDQIQQNLFLSPTTEASQVSFVDENDDDLIRKYGDLSIYGCPLDDTFTSNLEDEPRNEDPPQSLSSGLYRVPLHRSHTSAIMVLPVIPSTVMELEDKSDEDELDCSTDRAAAKSPSLDGCHNSLGTTLRMLLNGKQVYCMHLHPGTECTWAEVFLRASTAICGNEFTAFTAKTDDGEEIDVSDTVPSLSEVRLNIVPLTAFQTDGWDWKVEDGRLSYHPSYQGHFGPDAF